jgi:hypothetical protein
MAVSAQPAPRSELCAPAPLAALALLALNDHVLKARLHNALTGKLSDLALCFVLPLLIAALLRPLWPDHRARLAFGAVTAALVFTGLELSSTADAWLAAALAPFGVHATFTRDPSDLLALALVPLAWLYGRHRVDKAARPVPLVLRAGALGGALVLLGADSDGSCREWAAPVAFALDGDCGLAATMVVEVDEYHHVIAYSGDRKLEGQADGWECPAQLANGGWHVDQGPCAIDAQVNPGSLQGCSHPARRCTAALDSGQLWLTCDGGDALPRCRGRLTLVDK